MKTKSISSNNNFRHRNFTHKLSVFIASGFGSGYLSKAPGTFGTLVGFLLALSLYLLGYNNQSFSLYSVLSLSFLTLLALKVTSTSLIYLPSSEKVKNKIDPQWIVIDEILGYFFSIFFVEWNYKTLILGFLLFRIFDISKPFPVKTIERLPGVYGIVLDDVFSALYAALTLYLLLIFKVF